MDKEEQILQIIRFNPYITQQELADQIGLSRPAVANYIKRLIEAGRIKGRAYVLNDEQTIACVGGANVDRKAHALQAVRLQSSNPVKTEESLGGVARNVAENLARLNLRPGLTTVVGQDKEGEWLRDASFKLGLDTQMMMTLSQERTGTYSAFLDPSGELVVSMADMAIYDALTKQLIQQKWSHIKQANAIFLDTNIATDALQEVIEQSAKQQLTVFVDPVSSIKAEKLPKDLTGVHTILPNQEEAETLSGITINHEQDYALACQKLLDQGVQQVVLTLGAKGIYYYSQDESGFIEALPVDVKDVTGAGDAFTSGVIYGATQQMSLSESCRFGLGCATVTLESEQSCAEDLSVETVYNKLKELN
ncbi:carbohydrate kinase [Alkalibacillus salilacus]|uniref:Pseudouridine kinase n=1 Tax=Alkalibacillus salilacus TaxID=284582 RepID=A0ABT9VB66_9BACI|nr:carbohydrate kinase [Alkalibacillus salilacus]MDQ0158212.1 pseudouridine kinase [Alkalibacillus salilacus]